MTSAASTILVLFNSTAFPANMLVFRLKIICMAGCTEGRILRVRPGEHRVDAVTVAAAATQVPLMVTRIVALRVVTEAGRCPAGRYMAFVALECCVQVARRFGCCIATADVTLVAITGAAGVMNPGATDESGGGVAGRAVQAGTQVGWVGLRIHANCRNTIVAGSTIVDDAGVIESGREEAAGIVTDTTILVGWYMVERLAEGKRTVMTGPAVIDDADMTESGRDEAGRYVTLAAVSGGWHMVGRRHFARGGNPVVAGSTIAGNTRVIEPRARKGGGVMA